MALNGNSAFCDKISSFAKYSSLCHLALELRQVSDLWRVLFSFAHSNKKALNKRSRPLYGADDETRTRDSLLGRQILYQLSYVRLIIKLSFVITAPLRQPARLVFQQADSVDSAPSGFALLALPLTAGQLSYVRIKPIYNKPKTFSSLINIIKVFNYLSPSSSNIEVSCGVVCAYNLRPKSVISIFLSRIYGFTLTLFILI